MDILTGDPFYYNIIYHLSLKDIKCLKCLHKHLKFTLTKKHINQCKINSIKNDVYRLFNTKEQKQELKQIIANKKNDNWNTKYFVICVSIYPFNQLNDYWYTFAFYDTYRNYTCARNTYRNEASFYIKNNTIISIFAMNNDIELEKLNINQKENNLYLLDNDDNTDVFSLLGL